MLYKRNNPQLNKNGELIHLLSTEGLSKDILTHILDTAANFVSGTVLRVDGARPQMRMGWQQSVAKPDVQERDAVKPFDGFHRAVTPKVFQ